MASKDEMKRRSIWDVPIKRRELLKRGAFGVAWLAFGGLAGFLPFNALGGADSMTKASAPFHWGRVKFDTKGAPYGQDKLWNAGSWCDPYFLNLMKKQTNINVDTTWREVHLDNLDEMDKFPMLFFTANSRFELPDKQKANLKEYLERGGFLFSDDCVVSPDGDFFFQSFKRMVEEMFGKPMERLPDSHAIYHCVYDIPHGASFNQGKDHGGYGLTLNGNLGIVLTPGDIHCGWGSYQRRLDGQRPWFKSEQIEIDSIRFAINMISYAMGNS